MPITIILTSVVLILIMLIKIKFGKNQLRLEMTAFLSYLALTILPSYFSGLWSTPEYDPEYPFGRVIEWTQTQIIVFHSISILSLATFMMLVTSKWK